MDILMIKPSNVFEVSPISANIDEKFIRNMIIIAQVSRLKPIIQELLYDDIILNIQNNTVTPTYAELLEVIKPALSFLSLFETLPFLNNNITAKGTRQNNDDKSNSVDLKTQSYLRQEVLNKGEYYLKLLDEFLKKNYLLYNNLYVLNNCNIDNNKKIYNSPTFFY